MSFAKVILSLRISLCSGFSPQFYCFGVILRDATPTIIQNSQISLSFRVSLFCVGFQLRQFIFCWDFRYLNRKIPRTRIIRFHWSIIRSY